MTGHPPPAPARGPAWGAVAAPGTEPAELRAILSDGRLDVGDDPAAAWRKLGVRVALRGRPGWDPRLARLGDTAPPWVAWRGEAVDGAAAVAVVGARRSTAYGREIAAWIAEDLARTGVTVVSGGAVGIDAAAHGAAVAAGGRTVVVLGCGHAVPYPRPHATAGGLFDRVLAAGGTVLSAEPPHAPPRRHRVRARNRIVAGLVDAVVVVEGAARSGTLVTAGFAADLGVPVLAVPGDVRAPLSQAPHQLLSEGAAPCRSVDDVLDLIGQGLQVDRTDDGRTGDDRPDAPPATSLPPAVATVLVSAWPRPVGMEDLARRAQLPAATVLAAVTRARIAGEVTLDDDRIRLRRPP